MASHLAPALGIALLLLSATARAADPVVSNLTAAQRAGTKLAETAAFPGDEAGSPADPKQTPKGLSDADWSGIRGAYEKNRHAIVANPDGSHQAHNSGQAWVTRFDGRGFLVTPDAGGWTWGLELAGCGEATEVRHDGGMIFYIREDGLTEWFVNDTRGLEQGWTLAKRPQRAGSSGPVRLNLTVRGDLRPQVAGEGNSVAFLGGSGSAVLTYGGLKAWDADGETVAARFVEGAAGETFVSVVVDDSNARYPITIDPVAQQAYLKAFNTGANDNFGVSVAISGDTVVVGAIIEDSSATGVNGDQADNSATNSGAAYVFVRSGANWSQQAYLKASNTGASDLFGSSVAVSGDTVVVGAYSEDSSATGVNGNQGDNSVRNSGAVYVFVRTGTTWSQQAYLKASNTAIEDYFGASLALSGDTVVVGASGEDSNATGVNGNQADNSASHSGAAYIFVRTGTAWSQQAYLKASNTGSDDSFGQSVAVSGDTVVVGAYGESSSATGVNGNQADNSASYSGAVYIFVRSGVNWSQQVYLKASNTGADDLFGDFVAVSGDTVVVGARGEDSSATGVNGNQIDNTASISGAAYIFVRSGTTWSQQAYLKASNTGSDDSFGISVAVSGDTVVVGAYNEDSSSTGVNADQADNSASGSGAAFVFVRGGTTWSQQAYLKASNTAVDDSFGVSVAVSGDTVVVGAPGEDSNATGVNGDQADNSASQSGAAYLFVGVGLYSLVTSAVNGIIDGAGAYEPGATATASATPNPGYVFTGWTSDATGTDNPLAVLMDANKSITANFAPDLSDADTDGLSAYLEEVVYGTDPALADTDGDGLSDGWEVGRGRFSIIAGSFTWQQARTNARSRSGDLASFPDENRWNRAMETLGANALDDFTGLWLGASDAAVDGTWTWVNGEAFSFEPWATGRPSTAAGNTLDYLEVSGGAGAEIGKWYDRSPTTVRDGYLLETGYTTDPKVADADGDGLNDSQEQTATTNPFVADTDGDGLNDGQEVNLTHTNPKLADSDGDGLNDAADDQDGDTLTNLAEITQHGTNPLLADTDSDGLSDSAELNHPASYFALVSGTFTYAQATADAAAKRGRVASFPNAADFTRMANKARQTTQGYLWIGLSDAAAEGTWVWTVGTTATYQQWLAGEPSGGTGENHAVIMENSTKWADTAETFVAAGYLFERVGLNPLVPDTDADGLSDGQEVNTTHSSPVLEDTDGDGLTDGAEINTHHSSPLLTDTDADGLSDRAEVEIHYSNPSLKDTDSDGFDDLFEVNTGFDPALATSTPDAQSSIRTAVEFRFNAATGVSYRIEGSTDLIEWSTVETDITGAGGVVTRFYSTEGIPKRYFRARRN